LNQNSKLFILSQSIEIESKLKIQNYLLLPVIEEKKNLNEEQKRAVEHINGPLLIVAGAGTGKTTVLIERLNFLINKKNVKTDEILLITFTEKAAQEIEERADKILPYGYVDLWINTFHGFCDRVLRDHSLDIGLPGDFKLLTQTEQWMLIKSNLDKFNLDYYRPLGNPTKFIHELLKHFSRLKDENISPEEYLKYAEGLKPDDFDSDDEAELEIKRIKELANAYHVYNKLLLDEACLDFGDLISYTIKLFKDRPNILKAYRNKFKFVMVDEFQDTNWSQYELIKVLSAPRNNLMVVGDDDQAIYKFRGASLSNIMQFKDDFTGAEEVVLNKNYRSGQEILDASYDFIRHNNPNRLEEKLGIKKELISPLQKKGEVKHTHFATETEETEETVKEIIEIYKKEKDIKWSDFAILVRANDTADKFVAELSRMNVPNQFISLRGLYFKPVILDIIAYFKLLDNYHESSALYRVLNMDLFKVEHSDIVTINKFARKKVWSTYEALYNVSAIPGVSESAVENINNLLSLIKKHSFLVKNSLPSKIYVNFVQDSGLIKSLDNDRNKDIFDYLNQFYSRIKKFEDDNEDLRLKTFMEMFLMELEAGETGSLKMNFEDADTVKIMTVHAAKGLEFEYVFLPGLVDKKFPVISRKEQISIPNDLVRERLPEGDVHIEEERRLFYVAVTRAKKKLYLSSASDYGGTREKKPSKFLLELLGEDEINSNISNVKTQPNRIENELLKDISNINKENKPEVKYELPKKFSFSQLAAYDSCPLQYKYSFILKIPVEEKVNFIFGRVMHNTLKDYFELTMSGNGLQINLFDKFENDKNKNKPSQEDLIKIYKKNWRDDGYPSKAEREIYYEKGLNICHGMYARLEKEGWSEVLFVEKNFNVKIGPYILRGGIDRIDRLSDGSVEIIDYKTGAPKEKLDAGYKKQLMLYKIAAEQTLGVKVSKLTNYYLENNSSLSFEAKPKDLEKLEESIVEQIEEIKKCNFEAKPGFLCSYCDFSGICEFKK